MKLAELTYEQAAAQTDAIVLVPVGSTEAHGPHLPLNTDVIISEELAKRTVTAIKSQGRSALIAPSIAYSVTEYAAPFVGTVSIPPDAAITLIAEICRALQRQGFRRICLINSHLEPAHIETLRRACTRVLDDGGTQVAFPDCTERRWARTLTEEFKRGACHAGRYETSLVLAVCPERVHPARSLLPPQPIDLAQAMRTGAKTFIEAGADRAYFGEPAEATAAEGEVIYSLLLAMVLTTVDEVWST